MNRDRLLEMFGLDRDFTRADLEQAYRDLVQVWHPDRYSYNPRLQLKAEETLKEINNGYDLLREKIVKSDARTVREDTPESSAHPQRERDYAGYIKHELHDKSTGYRKRSSLVSLGNIFHPTDFSKASEIAFCHALRLAFITGARLSILHVAQNRDDARFLEFPEVRHTLERWGILPAGSSREDVSGKAGIHVEKIIKVHDDAVDSILHFLEQSPSELIVLATHQSKEPIGWLKKSVAMPIALGSGEMTLFVPEGSDGFVSVRYGTVNLKRVLIPIDNHPNPQLAINAASTLVSAFGCEDCLFLLLHIGDSNLMPVVHIPAKEGWRWDKVVRHGDVVKNILHLSLEYSADLIVMTTHGHEGFLDAFRGNTTERVLEGARCPLLAIPALRKHHTKR